MYLHFKSVDALHQALVEKGTALVLERLTPIDPSEPFTVRVDLLCGQRARINEDLGPILRAADAHARTSPTVAESREFGRRSSRAQLERIFATETDALGDRARRRVLASVDAVVSLDAWHTMRAVYCLSAEEARVATTGAVRALLSTSA